jgi:hypothetical protein
MEVWVALKFTTVSSRSRYKTRITVTWLINLDRNLQSVEFIGPKFTLSIGQVIGLWTKISMTELLNNQWMSTVITSNQLLEALKKWKDLWIALKAPLRLSISNRKRHSLVRTSWYLQHLQRNNKGQWVLSQHQEWSNEWSYSSRLNLKANNQANRTFWLLNESTRICRL